jgi:hypothetical protein
MVCTGRVPYTEGLGLAEAGIETVRGFVQVDETMRVLTKVVERNGIELNVTCTACSPRHTRDDCP